jgi:hypothetical protein
LKEIAMSKSIDDIMWELIEKVLDGDMTAERARYILAGSGRFDTFNDLLEQFQED